MFAVFVVLAMLSAGVYYWRYHHQQGIAKTITYQILNRKHPDSIRRPFWFGYTKLRSNTTEEVELLDGDEETEDIEVIRVLLLFSSLLLSSLF